MFIFGLSRRLSLFPCTLVIRVGKFQGSGRKGVSANRIVLDRLWGVKYGLRMGTRSQISNKHWPHCLGSCVVHHSPKDRRQNYRKLTILKKTNLKSFFNCLTDRATIFYIYVVSLQ